MAKGLPVFPSFNVQQPAVDTRWKKWCARQANLLVGLDVKDAKVIKLKYSLKLKRKCPQAANRCALF